jgi:hypothetical protein
MIHPMWGYVVECEEHDGTQHKCIDKDWPSYDICDDCNFSVVTCMVCQSATSCCPCGKYHSVDCPWPL